MVVLPPKLGLGSQNWPTGQEDIVGGKLVLQLNKVMETMHAAEIVLSSFRASGRQEKQYNDLLLHPPKEVAYGGGE